VGTQQRKTGGRKELEKAEEDNRGQEPEEERSSKERAVQKGGRRKRS
jgi:hypothetical protein